MATLGELNVLIGAEIDGFEAAMAKVEQGIGRVGDSAKSAGQALTTYVTLPLAGLATGALAAYGKIQQLQIGLQAVAQQQLQAAGVSGIDAIGLAATETAGRLKLLEELAKAPGLGFSQAVQGDIRLRSVGLSAEQSAKAIKEFANAIATTGGGRAEFDRVTVQLGQLSAKGKVLAQDLRPIIEAAPAVAGALQRLYGTVDSQDISDILAKQGQGSKDFVNALTDELGKLPRVGASFSDTFENFQESGVRSLAKIGESLNKAFDISGVLDRLSDFAASAADSFSKLDPSTQKLIFGLGAAAAAAGPLLFAFGAVAAAIPSVVAGLEVLGLASTAALGPIGIGVAAVAAAAYLIIDHWDDLVAYFQGPAGDVFSDLFDGLGNAVGSVVDAFKALADGPIGDVVAGLVKLQAAFDGKAIAVAVALLASSFNFLAGSIRVTTDLLGLEFRKAAIDAASAGRGMIQPLTDLLGIAHELPAGFEGAADGGGRFGTSLLQLSGVLTGFNTQLQGFAGGLPQYGAAVGAQAGLLETLRKRLADVKDAREKEATAAAISADTKVADGLQKQIDALLGIDRGAKAAAKSIKDLAVAQLGLYEGPDIEKLFKVKPFEIADLLPKLKDNDPEQLDLKAYYDNAFKGAAQSVTANGGQLVDAFDSVGAALTDAQESALDRQRTFNTDYEALIDSLDSSIGPLLGNIAGQFGDAFGKIITGTSTAGDAFKSLFGGILQTIGGFMSQFGEQLIALGVGKVAFEELFEIGGGYGAIIAGIGLVALGGIVSNVGKNASASISSISGGGSGSSLASQPQTNYSSTVGTAASPLVVRVTGELTGRGSNLVAVIREHDYRTERTS